MKKLLLTTAILALSTAAAHAAPTVYGRISLSLDTIHADERVHPDAPDEYHVKSTRTKLNSTTGRIGVKGTEDISDDLSVFYQLEYGVTPDSGSSTQFNSRDTFLGVKHKKYGALTFGRMTTPDIMLEPYANMVSMAVDGGDNILAAVDRARLNNVVQYTSPTVNGVTGYLYYTLDENNVQDWPLRNNLYSATVKYEPTGKPYRVGASYTEAPNQFKALRLAANYKVTPKTSVGAIYQNTDFGYLWGKDDAVQSRRITKVSNASDEHSYTVSVLHQTDTPWHLFTQYDYVDHAGGCEDAMKERLVVGGKYYFNKSTIGHVYASYKKDETVASQTLWNQDFVSVAANSSHDKRYGVGVGLQYFF